MGIGYVRPVQFLDHLTVIIMMMTIIIILIVVIFIILTITPIFTLLLQVREGEAISSINGEDAVNLTREVGTST